MNATATKTRKTPTCKATTGTVRLARSCDANGHHGTIYINRVYYTMERLADGGFRLMRVAADGLKCYQLPADLRGCDCNDSKYRRRLCKHALGLAALREAGRLVVKVS